ncbi:4-hydroxyphenylpyruvate dioxygenase [Actinospica durhamensis]|uniref:4-hydroxyphenylpyruvate dioxygenase n=1 Tax=Actinospica durhamensis TaxID=1508375 RepID=A0A941EPI9_9ACTN|nr:4-hydroxyphenylpyruvate dioxygenase [Actinospica durhamensis]MBR7835547.1 4-hydroxyphenylpyruvate dioxygenase [Actinospica durhamensis]
MTILGVDHVEFSVADARQTASSLCRVLGFRVLGQGGPESGLDGALSVLIGQGEARIRLTSGLNAAHPASGYVARHGDGVSAVAFRTDDAAAAYADAVAAGASPLAPPSVSEDEHGTVTCASVSGFGDVAHHLIERQGAGNGLPGITAAPDAEPDDTGGELLIHGIDHAAACVPGGSLEATALYYEKAFGFRLIFEEYIEVGAQAMFSKVVQSPSGTATFTFLEPDLSHRAGQIDDFLAWHEGPGVQHLALTTTDIAATVTELSARGTQFAQTPPSYYAMLGERIGASDVPVERLAPLGILVDRDHWGRMYQIFATSTHIRRTFFWELIERHGSRTFGTSNIPALYAAKERELAAFRETTEAG